MTEPIPAATPPLSIDLADALGARAAARLRDEEVVWLTTVGRTGAPAPNPVWFRWDGASTVIVYTTPAAARLRHLATNPQVSLHFDTDGDGGDIVVVSGMARAVPGAPSVRTDAEYLAKYAELIPSIGDTPETFAATYSVCIAIGLTRLRGL